MGEVAAREVERRAEVEAKAFFFDAAVRHREEKTRSDDAMVPYCNCRLLDFAAKYFTANQFMAVSTIVVGNDVIKKCSSSFLLRRQALEV